MSQLQVFCQQSIASRSDLIDTDLTAVELIIALEEKILSIETEFYNQTKQRAQDELRHIRCLINLAIDRTNNLRDIIQDDGKSKIHALADLP